MLCLSRQTYRHVPVALHADAKFAERFPQRKNPEALVDHALFLEAFDLALPLPRKPQWPHAATRPRSPLPPLLLLLQHDSKVVEDFFQGPHAAPRGVHRLHNLKRGFYPEVLLRNDRRARRCLCKYSALSADNARQSLDACARSLHDTRNNFGPALLLLHPRVAVGHAAAGHPHPRDATAVPRFHFKTPHSRDGVGGVEHIF